MTHHSIILSQELIKIPSLSGKNDEVITFMSDYLTNLGFTCDILEFDGDGSYPVNNLHAVFNPQHGDNILYFAGHTDVVDPGNKDDWTYDPFSATITDDKLFGRGAVDMKCAVACFMSSVAEFLKYNPNPSFGIGFLITNDEEADSVNGTKKVLKWMEESHIKMTHCIVGEPTNPSVFGEMMKVGRRGSINFTVNITGRQGHVAYPENAMNPNTILVSLLKVLKDHQFDNGNAFFDPTNLEITAISSQSLGNNVIPNESSANFNVRFNDTHTSQSIIELVEYACQKSAKGLGADYVLSHRTSGESFLSEPGKLADLITKAVKKISDKTPVRSTTGGTSDARFIKDYAQVVEFGLINKTAHQINEFTSLEDVIKLHETYLEVLRNFN